MHEVLEEAAVSLGIEGRLAHLASACQESRAFVQEAKQKLRRAGHEAGLDLDALPLDVVAFGSYAREEASRESDFDYLVIAYGLCDQPRATRVLLKQADLLRQLPLLHAERARGVLYQEGDAVRHKEIAGPGNTGMFGRVVSAPDLVERIGLEQDTNQSQTIRMLLLEESKSLLRDDLHEALIRVIIRRYLYEHSEPRNRPPRFLLNDVLRYWRTVAVDYAAKRYEQLNPEWGLRYLKLILGRKLTYAGTLVSLLSCGANRTADENYLYQQLTMPPLARLSQLHRVISEEAQRDALRTVLLSADWFNDRLGDADFRTTVKRVEDKDSTVPAFLEAVERARILQRSLEVLFFEAPPLRANAVTYLSF